MSFAPCAWRPFAHCAGGGMVTFRGASSAASVGSGVPGTPAPQVLASLGRGQVGALFYRSFVALAVRSIVGVTRDSAGAPLGNCSVDLLRTVDDVRVAIAQSDTAGNFRFDVLSPGPYYLVAYLAGAPDVAGTSVNTLQPV